MKEIPLHHNILKTNHDECSHALEQSFLPWQQLDFNMKIIFMTLVTTTLSESIVGENFDPHCEGSLNIFDTSGKRHSFAFSQDGLNKLKILNATVHGCGCFRMHKFNKGRGQSMSISFSSWLLPVHWCSSCKSSLCSSASFYSSFAESFTAAWKATKTMIKNQSFSRYLMLPTTIVILSYQ